MYINMKTCIKHSEDFQMKPMHLILAAGAAFVAYNFLKNNAVASTPTDYTQGQALAPETIFTNELETDLLMNDTTMLAGMN